MTQQTEVSPGGLAQCRTPRPVRCRHCCGDSALNSVVTGVLLLQAPSTCRAQAARLPGRSDTQSEWQASDVGMGIDLYHELYTEAKLRKTQMHVLSQGALRSLEPLWQCCNSQMRLCGQVTMCMQTCSYSAQLQQDLGSGDRMIACPYA